MIFEDLCSFDLHLVCCNLGVYSRTFRHSKSDVCQQFDIMKLCSAGLDKILYSLTLGGATIHLDVIPICLDFGLKNWFRPCVHILGFGLAIKSYSSPL